MNIEWLGHDSFHIQSTDTHIYIDPYELKEGMEKADLLLLTHTHGDHTSLPDIEKIKKKTTAFVTTPDSPITENITVLSPGEKEVICGITVEAVPAYNTDKNFHTKDKGWNGYILTIEGKRVYHAGDTDCIPEMSQIHCDVAMLPVSGTYVMTAEQAVEAARKIKPKLAIPMHFGSIVGSEQDAKAFEQGCKKAGIKVKVLKKGEIISF